MRAGGNKQKGSSFEREICKALSLWVTDGKKEDVFWRSAMSGGRATVAARKGKLLHRQSGDITAIAPEGFTLVDNYYLEVKHLKDLNIIGWITRGTGVLAKHWKKTKTEAKRYKKQPIMIVRQNRMPTICLCKCGQIYHLVKSRPQAPRVRIGEVDIWPWDDVLAQTFALKD